MFDINNFIAAQGFTRNKRIDYVWQKDGVDYVPRYWLSQNMPFSKQWISLLFADSKLVSNGDMICVNVGARKIHLVKKSIIDSLIHGKLEYSEWKKKRKFDKAVENAAKERTLK